MLKLTQGAPLDSDLNLWLLGTQKFVLSKKRESAKELAFLEIKASEVSISLSKIEAISIRNQLEAMVSVIEITPEGSAKLYLQIEKQFLWADISKESIEILDLRVGSKVFALVKSNLSFSS